MIEFMICFSVRNLLMMSAVFSLVGGFILFIASIALLDALRKEYEIAFRFWLWTMVGGLINMTILLHY